MYFAVVALVLVTNKIELSSVSNTRTDMLTDAHGGLSDGQRDRRAEPSFQETVGSGLGGVALSRVGFPRKKLSRFSVR